MTRTSGWLVLAGAGILLTPVAASAQLMPGFGGFGGPGVPVIVPSTNPFFYVPQYRYQYGSQFSFNTMAGNFSFGTYRYYYGVNPPAAWAFYPAQNYLQSGSYTTGGATVRPDFFLAAQRELMRAQREASLPGAKNTGSGGSNAVPGGGAIPGGQAVPDALGKALAPPNPAAIQSGEALNVILQEIISAEAKGARGPSAYVPPLLLTDIRFAGSPAADLLNFSRQAGNLDFPAAFDEPALAALKGDLDKDFAAVAFAVQGGKAPEAAKVAKLEATFQKVQDAAGPAIKNLSFEDATEARRFLNRMASAIKATKGGTATGLIDPKWAAEGLTVADLVKHMTRHKLVFAPTPRGGDEAYTTMHRNLATYLFVLTQPKK